MLSAIKERLKWAVEVFLPEASEESPAAVLDLGRYDPDEERTGLFNSPRFIPHRLAGWSPNPELAEKVPGDFQHWPEFADQSFDLVAATHTLEHAPYPWLTMAEVARVLKPGGLAVLIEPGLSEHLYGTGYNSFQRHLYLPDFYRFSERGLAALAESAGLVIEHASMNMAPPGAGAAWFPSRGSEALVVARKKAGGNISPLPGEQLRMKGPAAEPGPVRGAEPQTPPLPPAFKSYQRQDTPCFLKTSAAKPSLVLIGDCTVISAGQYLQLAAPQYQVRAFFFADHLEDPARVDRQTDLLWRISRESEILFLSSSPIFDGWGSESGRTIRLPSVSFDGYYPDFYNDYALKFMNGFTSKIVVESFRRAYSEKQALDLFNHETYLRLGYYQAWARGLELLAESFNQAGLNLYDFLPGWLRADAVFMSDVSHPKDFVVRSLVDHLAEKHQLRLINMTHHNNGYLSEVAAGLLPLYPELAAHLGIPERGSYYFKRMDPLGRLYRWQWQESLSLEEFVHLAYSRYRELPGSLFEPLKRLEAL